MLGHGSRCDTNGDASLLYDSTENIPYRRYKDLCRAFKPGDADLKLKKNKAAAFKTDTKKEV